MKLHVQILGILILAQVKAVTSSALSAHISGSFFRYRDISRASAEEDSGPLCDTEIRYPSSPRVVHIDISATKWLPAHQCCTGSAGKSLLRAVLHTNRRASLKGFEQAFEAQLASVNITSAIQRVNDTRVTIHVPSFPDYQLPVSRVELINTKWIPRTSIISEQDIATVMGLHTVFVVARAIAAHGTLFHRQPRSDDEMRIHRHTLQVELEGDQWVPNVDKDTKVQEALLLGLLLSDKAATSPGFGAAFMTQWGDAVRKGEVGITRASNTKLVVLVPSLARYKLPKGGDETVRLGVVCGEATLGGHEIRAVDDATSEHGALVRYVDRTATVSGTFFGHRISEAQIKSGEPPIEVIIDLVGATWMHDIPVNDYRRRELATALWTPSQNMHPGGAPDTAWVKQFHVDNVTADHVKLLSPSRLSVSLHALPGYAAPGSIPEQFLLRYIPSTLLGRSHEDILHDKLDGELKAEVLQARHAGGEL